MEKRMEENGGGEETTLTIEDLKDTVQNTQIPLAERFRALFTLRNRGGQKAIDALIEGISKFCL